MFFFLYFAMEFNEITRQNARIYFNCIERCIHARSDKDLTTYFSIFLFDICILILAQNSGQTFHFYWFIYTDMKWFLVEYSKNFLHLFNIFCPDVLPSRTLIEFNWLRESKWVLRTPFINSFDAQSLLVFSPLFEWQ